MQDKAGALLPHPVASRLLAIFCALLWGSSFPVIKLVYRCFQVEAQNVPSILLLAGIRFLTGGILMYLGLSAVGRQRLRPVRRNFRLIVAVALILTVLQSFFFYLGVANTQASKASVLNSFGTLFTVVLAHFAFRDDKMALHKIAGCAVGLGGIIVINLGGGGTVGGFLPLGDGCVLLAAACFAAGTTVCKLHSGEMDQLHLICFQTLLGGGFLAAAGLILGGGAGLRPVNGITAAVLIGYLSAVTVLANGLWLRLLACNRISSISVFNLLIPIFGTICSALLLGEDIAKPRNVLGVLLACGGIFLVNHQENKSESYVSG